MGIGKRIKEARNALNMTQEELAKIIGVTKRAVANYENETSHPKEPVMYKMFDALQVDANYLFQDVVNIPSKVNDVTFAEYDHIKKYRNLDDPGRVHVDTVLQWETDRMEQLSQTEAQISELKSRPVTLVDFYTLKPDSTRITEYFRSASAGDGIFILGNEVKARAIIPESSWIENTDYVIGVSGDSMKPDFEDGDNVMVSQHVPLHHGDVGIFIVNGNVYIKEYGETELISRNPDFPNIKISEYDNIVCMGKVLGKLKGDYKIVNE